MSNMSKAEAESSITRLTVAIGEAIDRANADEDTECLSDIVDALATVLAGALASDDHLSDGRLEDAVGALADRILRMASAIRQGGGGLKEANPRH
jgi:hypothetical protein